MHEPIQMRPDMKLILSCARLAIGTSEVEGDIKEIMSVIGGVNETFRTSDIATTRAIALRHRVLPLLYQGITLALNLGCDYNDLSQPECRQDIAELMAELKRFYVANSVRNIRLQEEMLRVIEVLSKQDIKAIPVKGAVLALQAYGDLSLRQFDDLDFLVETKEIAAAGDFLCGKEYEAYHDLSPRERAAHIKLGYEYMVKHRETGDFVELHSSMASDYFGLYMTSNRLLSTTESILIDDRQVNVLSKKDTLLLLCEHAYKHCWERLSWLCDIAALLETCKREGGLNWEEIVQEARQAGCLRLLCVGCLLSERLFSVTMQPEIKECAEKDTEVCKLASEVIDWYAREGSEDQAYIGGHRFMLRGKQGIWSKLRYGCKLLLTPSYSDWKSMPLPETMFWLYYLTRPFRLLRQNFPG